MISSVMVIAMATVMQNYPGAEYSSGSTYQASGYGTPPQETDVNHGTYGRTSMPAEWVGGYGEQLLPYDYQAPWHHYYFQEMPAYGGFNAFRPYNYKHLLAQSQAAGGWGLSPQMPYAQQYWHRYQQRALMQKMSSNTNPNATRALVQQPVQLQQPGVYAPNAYVPNGGYPVQQQINPAGFDSIQQMNGQYPNQQR